MSRFKRGAGLVIIAAALAGCSRSQLATSPGPASSSAVPQTVATVSSAGEQASVGRACRQSGNYLTAVRGPYHVSTLTGPDRVVIDFSHVAAR
jgi:hypothetical protein